MSILETKDKLIVKAELLGLEAKTVNVSVSGDLLTFKGEKEEDGEYYHCVERRYGSFHRSFRMPTGWHGDKVETPFKRVF